MGEGELSPIACPLGYAYRAAGQADIGYMISTWKFAQFMTFSREKEQMLFKVFQTLPSIVIYRHDDELKQPVGIGIVDIIGAISKVFVSSDHRGAGLATFIMDHLAREFPNKVALPFAHVEFENTASKHVLQDKLGFSLMGSCQFAY